jgi:hypothetical protein
MFIPQIRTLVSEQSVKLIRLPFLLVFALVVGGCASLGGSGAGPAKVDIGSVSNLPQVTLPGASMADARSVAMAAARTKGWEIIAADANRLLLERPLPSDLPQAQALNSPLAAPRMQVETNIVERGDGAIVALRALVLTNPGTKDEKRIDYTTEYENQLLISLSSLSSAWLAARDKVRSEVPVLAEFKQGQETETSGSLGDVAATVGGAGAVAAASQSAAAPEPPAPAPAAAPTAPTAQAVAPSVPQSAPSPSPAPRPARSSPSPVASSTLIAPTIEAPASPRTAAEAATPSALRPGPSPSGAVPAPAPVAPTTPVEAAGSNDMLVLNQASSKGLWAYYAEDYARLRGCAIGDRGATLLNQTDGFEVHEVECVGGANVLVKCRGGVCEPMR